MIALARPLLALAALLLAACASPPPDRSAAALAQALRAQPAVLIGEQHDNPAHHALEAELIRSLAREGRLAAVAMEMLDAEQQPALDALRGRASPGEAAVRSALAWNDRRWPWRDYGPVILAALESGVPLHAAQPSRQVLAEARRRSGLPPLPDGARRQLEQALREGHCGMLPESRLPAMLWVQYTRDRHMAQVLDALRTPGRQVLLITGSGHARRDSGVPLHSRGPTFSVGLGSDDAAAHDLPWPSATGPETDHCAALRQQLEQRSPAP